VSHARWPSLAESSLDVSAAGAASASASRPRRWWIGLGAIVAAAASFALVAPRQRTLALRWLESEYHARLRPTADAISNSAPALRPGASAAASTPPAIGGATAQLEAQVTPPAGTMGESAVELPGTRDQAATGAFSAGTSAEDASFGAAGANVPNEDVARDTPASGNGSARKSKLVTRNARSAGTASKARAQVAAVRKPALRADRDQTTSSTTTSSTRVAARSATKARATRQNTPRKDGRSGIIRETPF
jgi:hypothetical protein